VEADSSNFALLAAHTAHQPNIFPVHAAVWSAANVPLRLVRYYSNGTFGGIKTAAALKYPDHRKVYSWSLCAWSATIPTEPSEGSRPQPPSSIQTTER
jgi:hypothetical protein